MKRAAIISYTDHGTETAQRIADLLCDDYEILKYRSKCDVWELFASVDVLIFVGACGIAVRAIAPYLRSKTTDPAVIVTDERGINVISLLSGHIGGANELTRCIAQGIGGMPVITTATDVNGRFAADEWAAKHGAAISSMQAAKCFAMEILKRDLPMASDYPVRGELPNGLFYGDYGDCGMEIACAERNLYAMTLTLIPRIMHMGIGCKRGTEQGKIRSAVENALAQANIDIRAVASVASIDVKQDEEGLLAFCREGGLPLRFHTAEELQAVQGDFSASDFVRHTVGLDNVCERAAMLAAGKNARLILKKTCLNGVTVAIAQEEWSVCFE